MTSMINKTAAFANRAVLMLAGIVMAGMGLAFVGIVALFAFAIGVLALLVAPFAAKAEPSPNAEVQA